MSRTWGLILLLIVGTFAGVVGPSPRAAAYTPHAPIFISGDLGFTAANGVTAGNGTALDPYVIEGWEIDATAQDAIKVSRTNAFFVVRNVLVHARAVNGYGIHLWAVTHATLENVTATEAWHGVYVLQSGGVTVRGSTIVDNTYYGVYLEESPDATFEGNEFRSNGDGVRLESSFRAGVRNNRFLSNGRGLYLWNATASVVHGNHFIDNIVHASVNDEENITWDLGYPAGGNYWYDYPGEDRCTGPDQLVCTQSDGIGDSPYEIGWKVSDRYPRMPPGMHPEPRLAVTPSSVSMGEVVTFDGSSSWDSDGSLIRYRWDFGDGNTSEELIAQHIYEEADLYTITLTVTDDRSWSRSASVALEVNYRLSFVTRAREEFRVRVPAEWRELGGTRLDLSLQGPTEDGIPTVISIDANRDPRAADPGIFLPEIVREIRRENQGNLVEVPRNVTVAGRPAVSFALAEYWGYPSRYQTERFVVVADAEASYSWLLVLSVASAKYGLHNLTFERILESFEPAPPLSGNVLAVPVAMTVLLISVVAVTAVVVMIRRSRRARP